MHGTGGHVTPMQPPSFGASARCMDLNLRLPAAMRAAAQAPKADMKVGGWLRGFVLVMLYVRWEQKLPGGLVG